MLTGSWPIMPAVMLPRFLVPDLDGSRTEATLPPDEAHHLTRVLRLRVGDPVAVFDGRGLEFAASVAAISRGAVTVRLGASVQQALSRGLSLTLVQAILKTMDDVVRDATMVGVDNIQPVVSANTTVKESVVQKAAGRWERIALASAKQCGRARLPAIREVVGFERWLASAEPGGTFLLVEPGLTGPDTLKIRDLCRQPPPERASLVVGPEGGWTSAEREAAVRAGLVPLTLGRMTLRADAVPLAAAAALFAVWDD
ncbi:16S rRNA (uracil(1498)-N(3))-methyltransferase [soil metagenome]